MGPLYPQGISSYTCHEWSVVMGTIRALSKKTKKTIIVLILLWAEFGAQHATLSIKDCYFLVWLFEKKKKKRLFTQMDSETTACVACLPHSCALRPGWDTDCNQTSGWELGRRHAGRQDRHLSHPLRGGKRTDIPLKRTFRATFTRQQSPTFHMEMKKLQWEH